MIKKLEKSVQDRLGEINDQREQIEELERTLEQEVQVRDRQIRGYIQFESFQFRFFS